MRELASPRSAKRPSCPNIGECWGGGTATFMIMGDVCTRACRFCARQDRPRRPPLDPDEPRHARRGGRRELDLEYIVVTSVDRDDLPDGGAAHFAAAIARAEAAHARRRSSRCSSPTSRARARPAAPSPTPAPTWSPTTSRPCERLTPDGARPPRQLPPVAGVLRSTSRSRPERVHQDLHHARPRRDRRRGRARRSRPARGRRATSLTLGQYLQPSQAPPGRGVLTPEQFADYQAWPTRWASCTSPRARWSALATAPPSCSSRARLRAARPSPAPSHQSTQKPRNEGVVFL